MRKIIFALAAVSLSAGPVMAAGANPPKPPKPQPTSSPKPAPIHTPKCVLKPWLGGCN